MHILNVAEKPSVARSLATIFSQLANSPEHKRAGKNEFNAVHTIENVPFKFGPRGNKHKMCVTSVLGHIMETDFSPNVKFWNSCDPGDLLDPNVSHVISEVRDGTSDERNERRAKRRCRAKRVLSKRSEC